jgi:hypothetical protein
MPAFRASDNPIAIACFGFVTFWPLPLRSLPWFMAFNSVSTFLPAASLYFAVLSLLPSDFLPFGQMKELNAMVA